MLLSRHRASPCLQHAARLNVRLTRTTCCGLGGPRSVALFACFGEWLNPTIPLLIKRLYRIYFASLGESCQTARTTLQQDHCTAPELPPAASPAPKGPRNKAQLPPAASPALKGPWVLYLTNRQANPAPLHSPRPPAAFSQNHRHTHIPRSHDTPISLLLPCLS
jgi:hypothetical protein